VQQECSTMAAQLHEEHGCRQQVSGAGADIPCVRVLRHRWLVSGLLCWLALSSVFCVGMVQQIIIIHHAGLLRSCHVVSRG
jgi:hypothetical protein